jgi:hypothetical protein
MVSAKTLFALALPTLGLSKAVAPRQIAIPEDWTWQVENWSAGCARGGCYYKYETPGSQPHI